MSLNVLLGPAEYRFSDADYARTYNFLRSLPDDVTVDAVVGAAEDDYTFRNATLIDIDASSQLRYGIEAFRTIRELAPDYDVVHYPNMNFPDWDPVLLWLDRADVPVVVGPCEAGHTVPPESFHNHLRLTLGVDLPEAVTYRLYRVFQAGKSLARPARLSLFRRSLVPADRVVAVNEATKSVYDRHVDADFEVIPYGVALDRLSFAEREPTGEVLTVGALIERKGHEDLLRAFARVREAVPDATLQIVGTGPRREQLEDLVAELGIGEAVTFHGNLPLEAFRERFRRAQVFVHASTSEGYSHVRLEAMASGCPVVGTDVRGAAEMVRDGTDGFVVERENPGALADATIRLLEDPDLARRMGIDARDRVERRHDWGRIADRYVDIYEELAGC